VSAQDGVAQDDVVPTAVTPQEPIGSMLVKRGLITEAQLADALEQQRTSGEQLGAILVARGYAPPALVAQALATQQGKLLKTEYGFATGFGRGNLTEVVGTAPPVSIHPARSSIAVAAQPAPLADRESDREAVRAELELASSESTRLAEANERLSTLRVELEQRLAHETQRSVALERELAAAQVPVADELAAWQQSNAQLDAALTQWQAAYTELEQRFEQSNEHAEHRETELRRLESSGRELAESARSFEEALVSAEHRAVTVEARCAQLEHELEQAAARADAADERAAAAEEARSAIDHRLAGIAARADALQVQVDAAEEIRESLAASEEARATLDMRLQEAVEGLGHAAVVRNELEGRLEAMTAEAATLEAVAAEAGLLRVSLEAATAEADELRLATVKAEHETAVLEQRLIDIRAELEQRDAERNSGTQTVVEAAPWAGAESHLVFFQGSQGYELAELDGPPPAVGTQIELPALPAQTVARIGRSPLRGDSLPCAYLLAG
jgi:chromosome segregation ATPase